MLLAGCSLQGEERELLYAASKKTAEVALKASLVTPWGDEHSVRGKQYRLWKTAFFHIVALRHAVLHAPCTLHPAPIPQKSPIV